jgi:hypothetical protein
MDSEEGKKMNEKEDELLRLVATLIVEIVLSDQDINTLRQRIEARDTTRKPGGSKPARPAK